MAACFFTAMQAEELKNCLLNPKPRDGTCHHSTCTLSIWSSWKQCISSVAMLLEVPNMTSNVHDIKQKVISQPFCHLLDINEHGKLLRTFATRALGKGTCQEALKVIQASNRCLDLFGSC
jgi:hypothetical protein